MSTEYESKLVVGCYLSVLAIPDGMEDWEYWQEDLEHQDINWYEDCGFIGFEVEEEQPLTMSNASKLSIVAKKFKKITGQTAIIKACLLVY